MPKISIISKSKELLSLFKQHPKLAKYSESLPDIPEINKDDIVIIDLSRNDALPKLNSKNHIIIIAPEKFLSKNLDSLNITFIKKPYHITDLFELVLQTLQHQKQHDDFIKLDKYQFSYHHKQLVNKKITIGLTEKETEIINLLLQHNKGISKDDLLHKIWGYGKNIDTHTLETHIYRMRQKVGDNDFIKNAADGYML